MGEADTNWLWRKKETIRVKCDFCGNDMTFVEGDVIFGEKWYHKECAKQASKSHQEQLTHQ